MAVQPVGSEEESAADAHALDVGPGTAGTAPAPASHPLEAMVDTVEAAIHATDRSAWEGLAEPEIRALYGRLSRVCEQLSAHRMTAARVLDAAGTAAKDGATSTGSMLGADFGGDRRTGDDLVRLGNNLSRAKAVATEEGFATGAISQAQADVIAGILSRLPDDVTPQDREMAENTLLAEAPTMSLRDLRRRGDRISEVFRSTVEQADADEEAIVKAREARARARTEFWLRDSGDGTYRGGFTIPTLQGEMLKTMLEASAAPRRDHLRTRAQCGAGEPGPLPDERTYPQKLGQAFCALIEHVPTDGFAHAGGSAAVIAVSLSWEKLASGTGCGSTSTGVRLSAGEIRRLACTHKLLPQVFNGTSLPLDHGTTKRLFDWHQRVAYAQRDQGCATPGCDRPPAWCEVHHAGDAWAAGGPTDLDQGVMLCPFHHHQLHQGLWVIRFNPRDGIPEFRKPLGTTGPGDTGRGAVWRRNTRYKPPRDLGVAPETA